MAQARNSDAHRMFTQRLRDEPSFSQSFIGQSILFLQQNDRHRPLL